MRQSSSAPVVPFGNAERLLLAQLETARSIHERREGKSVDAAAVQCETQGLDEGPWKLLSARFTPHDWQRRCLDKWLPLGRGTVKVATGGGKTKFALLAAQELQRTRAPDLRMVVVVPTVPLMYQWRDELLEGDVRADEVGLLGGGSDPPDLGRVRILISVINSARERLPDLVRSAGWSERLLLVVDECHRANAEKAQRIFDAKPAFTLGLSATPEQELEGEGIPPDEAYARGPVGQGLGPIIFEFSLKESAEAGLVTPFEIWHVGLPLTADEANEHRKLSSEISDLRETLQAIHRRARSTQNFIAWCQTQASRGGKAADDAGQFISLTSRRKRLLYRADSRIAAALAFLREGLADPASRAIVFHELIEETESLYGDAVRSGLPAVLEHSQLPGALRDGNIELFRRGTARVVVSAKSLIEGFNVPAADLGIIAASTGSARQRIQSLGRMLRKKADGRTARVIVLYIRDSEDEIIYETADWAGIVGAERNRFFEWKAVPEASDDWRAGLREVQDPPRRYRPPSSEIDVSDLRPGDPYPGKADGVELKIDQQFNARDQNEVVVAVDPSMVRQVVELNPLRRARITPAGHLIVRVDDRGEPDWRFLGRADATPAAETTGQVILKIKQSRGQRHFALGDGKGGQSVRFALSSENGATEAGDRIRRQLFAWIGEVEASRALTVRELLWDCADRYWLEIGGERLEFPGPGAKLEFKE
jgi:superfamily II DNA or RNA helicase